MLSMRQYKVGENVLTGSPQPWGMGENILIGSARRWSGGEDVRVGSPTRRNALETYWSALRVGKWGSGIFGFFFACGFAFAETGEQAVGGFAEFLLGVEPIFFVSLP